MCRSHPTSPAAPQPGAQEIEIHGLDQVFVEVGGAAGAAGGDGGTAPPEAPEEESSTKPEPAPGPGVKPATKPGAAPGVKPVPDPAPVAKPTQGGRPIVPANPLVKKPAGSSNPTTNQSR